MGAERQTKRYFTFKTREIRKTEEMNRLTPIEDARSVNSPSRITMIIKNKQQGIYSIPSLISTQFLQRLPWGALFILIIFKFSSRLQKHWGGEACERYFVNSDKSLPFTYISCIFNSARLNLDLEFICACTHELAHITLRNTLCSNCMHEATV